MSKIKFEAARELIQEERYHEARAILKQIDHPKAKEWLEKLDSIAPPQKSRNYPLLIGAGIGVVTLVAIILIVVLIISNQQTTANLEQQSEAVTLYCMSKIEDGSREECSTLARTLISDPNFSDVIAHCSKEYSDNLESFSVCMQEVERVLNLRYDNNFAQTALLYEYCTGSFSFDFSDDNCLSWANQVTILLPVAYPATDSCWKMEEVVNILFEDHLEETISAIECIKTILGEKFPPSP